MKILLIPKTAAGKWSVAFCISFVILILLKINTGIPLPTFAIAGLGIAGFITGITAVIKKDRAAAIFISILIGLVIFLWITAEIIYPH